MPRYEGATDLSAGQNVGDDVWTDVLFVGGGQSRQAVQEEHSNLKD